MSRGVERHHSIISFVFIKEDSDLSIKIQTFRSSRHPHLSHVSNGLRGLVLLIAHGLSWVTELEDSVDKEPHSLLQMHMKQA